MTIKLTKRQGEILHWVQQGLSNKHIAQRLKISEGTIKMHMSAIFKRHGVRNRMQLLLTTTKGQQVVLLPIEIEQQPVVWAHLHGDTIKGIVFSKECPKEGWEPLYRKVQK